MFADGKYPGMGYTLGVTLLNDDFDYQNPSLKPEAQDMSWQLYTERCKIATPDTFTATNWDLFTFDSPSMRKAIFDYDTELTNLITSAGDLETNWNKWVQSKMPMVQPVLDELNAMKK